MKKINFIDLLIVLLIVFVAVVAFSYFKSGNSDNSITVADTDRIKYNLIVEDVSFETASQMEKNDIVYNSVNGCPIGKIADVKVSEYTEDYFNKVTGEYEKVLKIEHYTVNMILEADAEKIDNYYHVGGLKLAIGSGAYLRGQNYVCQGRVMEITEVSEDE